MKILIVEDEKISQAKMKVIMAKYGICDAVGSGAMAIELFRKSWEEKAPYDIVTLDITLHEMSGLEVLLHLREIEAENKVPAPQQAKIMMVTSFSDTDHITSCITAGCNGYIIKPFTDESIAACLKKIHLKYIEETFNGK